MSDLVSVMNALDVIEAIGAPVPEAALADLNERYSEEHRVYHGADHVAAVLQELAPLDITHRPAVTLAALWHDAVYDPKKRDNELKSARVMKRMLKGVTPAEMIEQAELMVISTSGHNVLPMDDEALRSDTAHFLDADLSILGADDETYDRYAGAIRTEYAYIPDEFFGPSRATILQRFLKRRSIYQSQWGRDRFEVAARANLAREIERLAA